MNRVEMPIGFGMALSRNPEAMEIFAAMSEDQKKQVIAGAHSVSSRDDMHRYVSELARRMV